MLKKSLEDSWLFFKQHVVALSVIILPIAAPIDIFTAMYDHLHAGDKFSFIASMLPVIIGFIAYPIYSAAVIFYIASTVSGEKLDTRTLWRLGIKFWRRYIALSILTGLTVMFGFMLLIVPGVIFAVRYAFSEFDLLLYQSKPLEAMRNSWNTAKEYTGIILGGYIVITLALYVPNFLIASIFDKPSLSFLALDIVSSIIYSVLGAIYTIFAFRVYEFAKSQNRKPLNQNAP